MAVKLESWEKDLLVSFYKFFEKVTPQEGLVFTGELKGKTKQPIHIEISHRIMKKIEVDNLRKCLKERSISYAETSFKVKRAKVTLSKELTGHDEVSEIIQFASAGSATDEHKPVCYENDGIITQLTLSKVITCSIQHSMAQSSRVINTVKDILKTKYGEPLSGVEPFDYTEKKMEIEEGRFLFLQEPTTKLIERTYQNSQEIIEGFGQFLKTVQTGENAKFNCQIGRSGKKKHMGVEIITNSKETLPDLLEESQASFEHPPHPWVKVELTYPNALVCRYKALSMAQAFEKALQSKYGSPLMRKQLEKKKIEVPQKILPITPPGKPTIEPTVYRGEAALLAGFYAVMHEIPKGEDVDFCVQVHKEAQSIGKQLFIKISHDSKSKMPPTKAKTRFYSSKLYLQGDESCKFEKDLEEKSIEHQNKSGRVTCKYNAPVPQSKIFKNGREVLLSSEIARTVEEIFRRKYIAVPKIEEELIHYDGELAFLEELYKFLQKVPLERDADFLAKTTFKGNDDEDLYIKIRYPCKTPTPLEYCQKSFFTSYNLESPKIVMLKNVLEMLLPDKRVIKCYYRVPSLPPRTVLGVKTVQSSLLSRKIEEIVREKYLKEKQEEEPVFQPGYFGKIHNSIKKFRYEVPCSIAPPALS